MNDAAVTLYHPNGSQIDESELPSRSRTASNISDLDPTFWWGGARGTVTAADIEGKPYKFHWAVYACAKVICTNVARLPRKVFDETSNTFLPGHPWSILFDNPNPFMTATSFWQAVLLSLLIPSGGRQGRDIKGGQCFIIPVGKDGGHVDLTKGEMPVALYPYNDSVVTAEKNPVTGEFKGWKFQVGAETDLYAPNELIRISQFNPYDWLGAICNYAPAQLAVINDIKADIWNTRIYDNDAVPAGILSSDDNLNDELAREYEQRWYAKYGGPGNARRVAILGKGLKFQAISANAKDMDFVKQKENITEEIIATFGLNKIALGKYEQINYATIVEGRKMLWEDTYLPFDELINEQVTAQTFKHTNTASRQVLALNSDRSKIRILQPDIKAQVETAKNLYAMSVPTELALRLNGVKLSEVDLEAYPWLKEQPIPPPSPFAVNGEPPMPYPAKNTLAQRGASVLRITADARDKISAAYIEKVLTPGERALRSALVTYFNGLRNRFLDNVDAWSKRNNKGIFAKIKVAAPSPKQFDPDFSDEQKRLMEAITPAFEAQLRREYRQLKQELGADAIDWNSPLHEAQFYIDRRREEMKLIETTAFEKMHDKIGAAIDVGVAENVTTGELSKLIREAMVETGELYKNQSVTIARTENGIISSTARFDVFGQAGVEFKQWVNSADEKVRDNHRDEPVGDGGRTLPIGTMFPKTQLMYPSDPSGNDPGEIINCVLPGTIVSGSIVGALKAFYSGKVIELTTRNGNRVCVTVNHPIATQRGFIAAGDLCESDYIVCQREDADFIGASFENDEQYRETSVENVFNALTAHGTARVHTPTAFDLDGDAEFIIGNIDTVERFSPDIHRTGIRNLELMRKEIPSSNKLGCDLGLISTDESEMPAFESGLPPLVGNTDGVFHSASGQPHGTALVDNRVRVGTDTVPFQVLRLGLASRFDISRYQYQTYTTAGYAAFLRELIFAFSSEIFFDDVISVRSFDYSGHVYDLQSTVGYFNSNNIISRNCRCSLIAVANQEGGEYEPAE